MDFNQLLHDSVIRFKDYIISERRLSDNTVYAYHSDIIHFINYLLEHVIVDKFDDYFVLEEIDLYIIYLYNTMFDSSSIQRKLCSLTLYLKFLKLESLIVSNPSNYLIRPKSIQSLPKYLTLEEIEQFIKFFNSQSPINLRDKALYELLYSCGLRVSEVTELKCSDIYADNKIIKVTGKGDKQRLVPVGAQALQLIDDYINKGRMKLLKKKNCSNLFLNYRGEKLTRKGIWKNLQMAAKESGIDKKFTVHTLRHSFATHLIQNGADIRFVQTLLGHKSISTTEIYTHLDMNFVRSVYNKSQIR